jgi:hypothetical protein
MSGKGSILMLKAYINYLEFNFNIFTVSSKPQCDSISTERFLRIKALSGFITVCGISPVPFGHSRWQHYSLKMLPSVM